MVPSVGLSKENRISLFIATFFFLLTPTGRACLDCKVIPGECVVAQHKLVVADFRFHARVMRDKGIKITRTKWWKLKREAQQTFRERMITEGPWDEEGDADSMWVKMGTCIRKVGRCLE
ncbi:hypothetical protein ACQ4PT_028970 [Festuca glaucescens]